MQAGDGEGGASADERALRVVRLFSGGSADPALLEDLAALDSAQPAGYRALAVVLARALREAGRRRVGISGGQGTGKSTLARLLETACARVGLRVCVLALDDYYLPRAERRALARRVHPLFETRGPPGTHDVALCRAQLRALSEGGSVEVPVFDKGLDDRIGSRRLAGPFDLVVLEGWCVGAAPPTDAALEEPCNALERLEDPSGVWRRHQQAELRSGYAALWGELEEIVFLRAPDLDCVRRWRLAQESDRPPELRFDAAAIERFVAHYERITLDLMARAPEQAGWTISLGTDHEVESITRRAQKRAPS